MNKYIYIGNNKIAGELKMEKPSPIEYVEGDSMYPDDTDINWPKYQHDLKKWNDHVASLPTIEVSGNHNWKEYQVVEEGKDFFFENDFVIHEKTIVVPISKENEVELINKKVSTDNPQIHLSANDGKDEEEATQMVFHKMEDETLFIEVFPHSSKYKIYTYDMFTFSKEAKEKLIDFLNNSKTY